AVTLGFSARAASGAEMTPRANGVRPQGPELCEQRLTMAERNLFDLEGRSALVTGGGQGLGRAMALGLAKHGANIAILEINPETGQDAAHEMEGVGVKSLALRGDVTEENSANRAVHAVVDAW